MKQLKDIAIYVSDKIDTKSMNILDYISTDNMLPERGGIIPCATKPKASRVTQYLPGDVLVSNIRPYFKKIWFSNRIGGCSNDVIVFRVLDENKTYPKYLYYLLSQDIFFDYMMSGSNGTKMPRGNKKLIPEFTFNDVDIEKQKRIADILSAYDNLIENNQKQIKLLEEVAMRLYKEWFVKLRFPGYETTKIVDGVPEGWSRKKLIDIADITMGQSPKSEYYNDRQQGLPFHQGVTNYGYRFVIDETYSTNYTRIAEAGSILFSVRAPVGRMNITKNKIVIGRGLAAINHREGLQSFLFYMLKNRFYKDDLIGNGAIYASITKSALNSQEFLIPSDNLANKFNSVVKSIDQQITNADRQIILLKQARDKLLSKLMNGEIEI
ncbi:MAG: restriction endonuclease subunit S [Proteiniphilum sp.]|jgi:type I restriction enzyme S subunit|nr:restriction endonuclease subunit S [Proteiniphilum sp.]